jgi:predicted DNA-binding transcriptional regulator YafY
MRSARLLAILLALQARGRVTAHQMATELEVSERTIHRDMEALSVAGVPVYAERGRSGGWLLPSGYRSGPRGLDADELRALFLSAPGTVLGDLGLDRASESALTKLLLALPAGDRDGLSQTRQKLLVDMSTWRAADVEPVPCLAVVYEALAQDRRIGITYRRADGSCVDRELSPLGLVAKGRVWYLVATAAVGGDPRTYRVDRIISAAVCAGAAVQLPEFDLRAFWEASKVRLVSGVPRFRICLRAHPSIVEELERARRWSRLVSVSDADAGGWMRVEMDFELEDDAVAAALGCGSRVEVVEPAWLRARVATELAAAASLYADC